MDAVSERMAYDNACGGCTAEEAAACVDQCLTDCEAEVRPRKQSPAIIPYVRASMLV